MRLPSHYKLKGLKLRWFFKEALRGVSARRNHFKKEKGVWLAIWRLDRRAFRIKEASRGFRTLPG